MAKIIGTTGEGFIVEFGGNELLNLVGFYYAGEKRAPDLKVGDEVKVAEMFHQLYRLKRFQKEVDAIAGALRTAADLIEIKLPIQFTEEKEEKSND